MSVVWSKTIKCFLRLRSTGIDDGQKGGCDVSVKVLGILSLLLRLLLSVSLELGDDGCSCGDGRGVGVALGSC